MSDQGPVWPGYADLMTNLFAVALLLFVLSSWLLTSTYKVPAAKWEKIKEVEESVQKLEDRKYFVYQPQFKRHVFSQEVLFETGKADIVPEYHEFLRSAGQRIESLVDDLRSQAGVNIKYVLIIEGMASDDGFPGNYELSYRRALALYNFWQASGIQFDTSVCEVIISGSGTGGVGRYPAQEERKNQRFLIQMLPKVGAEGFEQTTADEANRPDSTTVALR
jgi:outer membrane protein OmpA-like peptidoglycan-associated protein